jgi:hypothetical protein
MAPASACVDKIAVVLTRLMYPSRDSRETLQGSRSAITEESARRMTISAAARWTLATAMTALVGGVVALYLERGEIDITSISVSHSERYNGRFVSDEKTITTPTELRTLVSKSDWATLAPLRDSTVSYKKLQNVLDDNEQRMNKFLSSIARFGVSSIARRSTSTSLIACVPGSLDCR